MNNNESDGQRVTQTGKRSARADFYSFLIVYGWEGPLAVMLGLRQDDTTLLVVGLALTAFFWGVFGREEVADFLKSLK